MCKKICKQIFKLIKKYDSIVIARHVGPDPDALGSQIALKESILATFPPLLYIIFVINDICRFNSVINSILN